MAVVSLVFLALLKPFYGAIFWACVLGLLFSPVQRRLLRRWGRRPSLCALLTMLICFIMCIIPALFILASFFKVGPLVAALFVAVWGIFVRDFKTAKALPEEP